MKLLVLFFSVSFYSVPIAVEGKCSHYFKGDRGIDCDLWFQKLGASTVDDKKNVMYGETLNCASNLVNGCGAQLDIEEQGRNLLKMTMVYSSKTYYIYTDEESANQRLGYVGDD